MIRFNRIGIRILVVCAITGLSAIALRLLTHGWPKLRNVRSIAARTAPWLVSSSPTPIDPQFLQPKKATITRSETITILRRVCDYQLAHQPREGQSEMNNGNWMRSTFYAGLMAVYLIFDDKKYLDQSIQWSESHHWSLPPEQEQPISSKRYSWIRHADHHCCAQTYLELYLLKHDPKMVAPTRRSMDQLVAHPRRGREEWWWCDALFMSPPALARLGAATGDNRYLFLLDAMWWDTTACLLDPGMKLFYRDKTFFHQRTKNGRKVFWSRGNGWVMAGTVRVLQYLPPSFPHRQRYVHLLQDMASAVAPLQGKDGLWRPSLLDADEFPVPDTSGTGFICYALAWGINHGYLDHQKYVPVVRKAWAGMVSAVGPDGKLGWVQSPSNHPDVVSADDSYEYGVGAFLLAGSEILKLQPDTSPRRMKVVYGTGH